METDIYNILPIYIYHNFELKEFIDNTTKLTLERRNIFRTYRILIILSCVLHKEKHQPNISEGWCFFVQRGNKKVISSMVKKEHLGQREEYFELYNLFYYIEEINYIYHQRRNKKEYSLQVNKEKEHSHKFKDCSDLSGLLRKFYGFKISTIKRVVIYFILYEINLFLHLFRA